MNDTEVRNIRWRYVGIFATALIVITVVCFCFSWGAQTTILLVRHADRQGSADALSTAGTARAQELSHVLEKSGISAIYTSEAVRTQQTAAPTASQFVITPVAIPAADVAGLVSTIRSNNSGQTVLVVGHSNTVPQIIAEFGGPAVTIGDTEYDNLYVLTLCRFAGRVSVLPTCSTALYRLEKRGQRTYGLAAEILSPNNRSVMCCATNCTKY